MRATARALLLLLAASVRGDVVHLTDGAVLEGRVSQTADGVQILLPSGASLFIPKERVASVERKPDVAETYLQRRQALQPGDLAGTLELGEWALAHGLEKSARKLAREALALDPSSVRAHVLLGESPVGGVWLTEAEAARRGFARLAKGWGEWDAKWAEVEADAGLTPEALAKARAALSAGDPKGLAGLSSRTWTALMHLPQELRPPPGPVPSGRLELAGPGPSAPLLALAWIPEGVHGEFPCLLALPGTEGAEQALAFWMEPAKAAGAALLCPLRAEDWEKSLAALRAKGAVPAPDRLVLAGCGGGADEALGFLERRPDRFCAAVLAVGQAEVLPVPDITNAADIPVLLLEDAKHFRAMHRLRAAGTELQLAGGRAPTQALAPETLRDSLREALDSRRVPWPSRLRRRLAPGDRHAWIRADEVAPGAFVEARVAPRNTLYLAGKGLGKLTLELSDDLVDLSQTVTVIGNGRTLFQGRVEADPAKALARLALDGDRHRIVTAEVDVTFPKEP